MARNREGLVLLLDVGPSMHHILPDVEKLCSMLVQKKLIYSKSDEVGVILFGTEETENELTKEVGGYEHVVVIQNIKVVDRDAVQTVKKLARGTVSVLDAIVVGMDMLIKKYGATNKGKKRMCLITDGLSPIKDPYEGSKEDQVHTIAGQFTKHGLKLECIVFRGNLPPDADEKIMAENDRILNLFPRETRAKIIHVESPTSLLGAIRTRNITPVTIFRGDLEITSELKIKVWVYKKTSEEKFPTLKKYSDKAPQFDKFAKHEVKVDYEYKSYDGSSKVVPPDQRIKGYQYGPHVVPISSDEWDAVKFKPEKGVKLLGFTDASNIMRYHYMKDVNIFIAEPGNMGATVAISALARAMKEMDKVAILRCAWRQGQRNVVIGVLTPNVSDSDIIPDSFYFNVLPFNEDIREFQFPSFGNLPTSLQPNEDQQKAADNFVMMLDLGPSDDHQEILSPDFTPNPVLERFYNCLDLKAQNPDAKVPPLDKTLKKITEPDPELFVRNKSVINAFRRHFEVKPNPKLKKSSRRFVREKPSGSDDEKEYNGISASTAADATDSKTAVKVEKIGNLTPVQDFEAMMSCRDSPEWVNKAIKDMSNKIYDLVEDSLNGDNYPKAMEMLMALRKGCIREQEPKQFNDFMRLLCGFCQKNDLQSFCDMLASEGLTLISKTEAADSDVSDEEARCFLVKKEPKTE
ncbi:hypothetical protein CDL15_Pgr028666 [Punica granatum]|uniref:ATP-dependent DNA helicase 2 subunit KU80 n=1 Tax=Punica granatum TaxID=22663 RepID=A0A218VXK4_PUNGR|nr:hypothetical protein CDL15_Pgr028666 [Punica granatum]